MYQRKTYHSFDDLVDDAKAFSLTTTQHESSTAHLTFHLALELGYHSDMAVIFYDAAKIHDVGKIFIPLEIIEKPDRLSSDEYELVKRHTTEGCKVLSYVIPDNDHAYKAALYHHERYDGSGYPYGVQGQDIPEIARLLAITDVYDALRSKRSYKEPITHSDAMLIMEKYKHGFDPEMFKCFVRLDQQLLENIVKSKYENLLTDKA